MFKGSLKSPKLFALFTINWRRSAANTNNKGDRGSPFLTASYNETLFLESHLTEL
jgi:hypothetical protein